MLLLRSDSIKVHVSPSLQEMPCPSPCSVPLKVLPSSVPVQVRLAASTWNLENNEHMWPCIVTSLLLPARQMPSNWLRVCSGDLLTGRFTTIHRTPMGLSGSDHDMSLDACTDNSYHTKYTRMKTQRRHENTKRSPMIIQVARLSKVGRKAGGKPRRRLGPEAGAGEKGNRQAPGSTCHIQVSTQG